MTDTAVDAVPKPDSANAWWRDLHTECYIPRLWAEAGISEFCGFGVCFFFLFGLIVAFKALPWFVFQSWLLIVLSQGGKFSEK